MVEPYGYERIGTVSIPFSWGTHFSRIIYLRGPAMADSSLNPLLMGDSLLTATWSALRRRPSSRVSIPFSWGTHFSPTATKGALTFHIAVSIPFSWGTHFSPHQR